MIHPPSSGQHGVVEIALAADHGRATDQLSTGQIVASITLAILASVQAKPWTITTSQAVDLRRKIRVFRDRTRTRKEIFLTITAPHGVKPNQWSQELVHDVVTIEDLFGESRVG